MSLDDVLVCFQVFHDKDKLVKFKRENAEYWVEYHEKAVKRMLSQRRSFLSRLAYHRKQIKKYKKVLALSKRDRKE